MPDSKGSVIGGGDYAGVCCIRGWGVVVAVRTRTRVIMGGMIMSSGSSGTGLLEVKRPDGGGVTGEDGNASPVVKVFAVEADCVIV